MATRPLDDLIQIVRNGGSLDLQAENLSREQLIQLVANIVAKATVILRGLNARPTDELVQISRNSAGSPLMMRLAQRRPLEIASLFECIDCAPRISSLEIACAVITFSFRMFRLSSEAEIIGASRKSLEPRSIV